MALAGKRILVTRPRELAQALAALVAAAGATPVLYPAIEIHDLEDDGAARARLARAGVYDLAVFVSPSAVRKGLALHAGPWPARLAAVGEGTRRELEQALGREVLAPQGGAHSDALLALPGLQPVQGWRALIVRGAGGREFLGRALAARGASVELAECYRRVLPAAPPPEGALDAACVGSGEALHNLAALLGMERLRAMPLFVAHERVALLARELGLAAPRVAGPGDAQMVASMVAYFADAK
jgi:uroporphyrinogen-III synthase